MPNILNVQALSVGYQQQILLRHLSFSLDHGEIMVVLGTNGIGKSTLIKALLGLSPILSGKITCAYPNSCGFMPQLRPDQQHLPLTVEGFLEVFPWGLAWKQQVIKELDLQPLWHKQLRSLSFGMWQRVNLAQAVSTQPRLMFLDEPTQGLDIDWQTRCYDFLARYAEKFSAGVCCISHDTIAVTKYAHKVLCLDHQPAHDVSLMNRAHNSDKKFVIYQHDHHQGRCSS
jgi:ABC-type Mn2+/Zn2+ transport system ATPase subunit